MNEMTRLYVDFHVIQTVPPSCINRDDTGSPKTALYGGVRRARVSSQSWKRAMRKMFNEDFQQANFGIRTKRISSLLVTEIRALQPTMDEEEALSLVEGFMKLCGISTKKKNDVEKTNVLFFISKTQIHNLAEYILAHKNAKDKNIKKEVKKLLSQNHSIDIALFGRMIVVSDKLNFNTDASAQVAHSISTHRVDNEYDYFTAIDDLAPEDNAGADMIGVVEFNSSTMYRYATMSVHTLVKELNGEKELAAAAVKEFAKAFIQSMPTGKQNTFANRTLPDAVLVTVRRDQPVNFVGAFESPVRTTDGGYAERSIQKLAEYANKIYTNYVDAPEHSWSIGMGDEQNNVNLKELLQSVHDALLEDLTNMVSSGQE
ncbi:type I-E CRISPR-associated protein Cas7/Cse4/CasC [Mitsuokella sp. WILCCON 0060]|uniref:type I-E CRISPR-associated protein Cas7/Cse4/CasC n=1 Tax=Mitsuokella sp. WILCCON 0060 TaxID=3345341 RepID=UPI003F1C8C9D